MFLYYESITYSEDEKQWQALTFLNISKLEDFHLVKRGLCFSALVILMLISGTRMPGHERREKHFTSFPRRKHSV